MWLCFIDMGRCIAVALDVHQVCILIHAIRTPIGPNPAHAPMSQRQFYGLTYPFYNTMSHLASIPEAMEHT